MKKRKQAIYWLVMFCLIVVIAEGLTLIYYFHKNNKHSFAIGQLTHDLKQAMLKNGIIHSKQPGYYTSDKRFGWVTKKDIIFYPEYCDPGIKYTTGQKGERTIPEPDNPTGKIMFIGGSITFGHCLNNNDTFPYILGSEHWKDWTIENMAVSGFGTHQAYMRLQDAIDSNSPPDLVIYAMIPHHVRRNYLGKNWLASVAPKKLPHFEIQDGRPVFQGSVDISSAIPGGTALLRKEIQLTSTLLDTMQTLCLENGIEFIVALLPNDPNYPATVMETLMLNKIPYVDLGTLDFEGISPSDRHPNAADNKKIAEALADSFITDKLNSLRAKKKSNNSTMLN